MIWYLSLKGYFSHDKNNKKNMQSGCKNNIAVSPAAVLPPKRTTGRGCRRKARSGPEGET